MGDCLFVYAGWLIDGTGNRGAERQLIKTENGAISWIEGVRDSAELNGLKYVDLSGCTVLPGLIDAHVHLILSGTEDPELRKRQLRFSFGQARPFMADRLSRYLHKGVMAVRDAGDAQGGGLDYAREIGRLGVSPVCIKAPGKAWHAQGRYGEFIGRTPVEGLTLAESIEKLAGDEDHIKIINSGVNSITDFGRQTAPQFVEGELVEVVRQAGRRNLPVMVHANGVSPVRIAVDSGCGSVEHGFFMGRENLARMADKQTFWVPTAFTMKSLSRHLPAGSQEAAVACRTADSQVEQIAAARELGVRVALGTDAGTLGVRHGSAVIEEMKMLMQAGYTVEGAVRCASAEGAELLAIQDELGVLKKKMPASFLAVPGPPGGLPESLNAVAAVYVRGTKVL